MADIAEGSTAPKDVQSPTPAKQDVAGYDAALAAIDAIVPSATGATEQKSTQPDASSSGNGVAGDQATEVLDEKDAADAAASEAQANQVREELADAVGADGTSGTAGVKPLTHGASVAVSETAGGQVGVRVSESASTSPAEAAPAEPRDLIDEMREAGLNNMNAAENKNPGFFARVKGAIVSPFKGRNQAPLLEVSTVASEISGMPETRKSQSELVAEANAKRRSEEAAAVTAAEPQGAVSAPDLSSRVESQPESITPPVEVAEPESSVIPVEPTPVETVTSESRAERMRRIGGKIGGALKEAGKKWVRDMDLLTVQGRREKMQDRYFLIGANAGAALNLGFDIFVPVPGLNRYAKGGLRFAAAQGFFGGERVIHHLQKRNVLNDPSLSDDQRTEALQKLEEDRSTRLSKARRVLAGVAVAGTYYSLPGLAEKVGEDVIHYGANAVREILAERNISINAPDIRGAMSGISKWIQERPNPLSPPTVTPDESSAAATFEPSSEAVPAATPSSEPGVPARTPVSVQTSVPGAASEAPPATPESTRTQATATPQPTSSEQAAPAPRAPEGAQPAGVQPAEGPRAPGTTISGTEGAPAPGPQAPAQPVGTSPERPPAPASGDRVSGTVPTEIPKGPFHPAAPFTEKQALFMTSTEYLSGLNEKLSEMSPAAAVGAHLGVAENIAKEIIGPNGTPAAFESARKAVQTIMEQEANDSFVAGAREALRSPNPTWGDLVKRGREVFDAAIATDSGSIREMMKSVDLRPGVTVSDLLNGEKISITWGPPDAELWGAVLGMNEHLFTIDPAELSDLVEAAKNGDTEALRKLKDAVRLIPSSGTIILPKNMESATKFMAALKQ